MRLIKCSAALLVILSGISGCGKAETDKTLVAQTSVNPEPAKRASKHVPTPEDWRTAVESAYETTNIKDQGEGVTEFVACFKKKEQGCENMAFASRDAFRKLRIYKSGFRSAVAAGTYLISYASLRDNMAPRLLLAPMLFNKDGWLFLNSIAIMVDGEVLIEQRFNNQDIKREIFPGGVQERADFMASDKQISALRKIKPESKVLIRFTGDKGYISLKKDEVKSVKEEIQNILFIYDKLNSAVADKTIPDTE